MIICCCAPTPLKQIVAAILLQNLIVIMALLDQELNDEQASVSLQCSSFSGTKNCMNMNRSSILLLYHQNQKLFLGLMLAGIVISRIGLCGVKIMCILWGWFIDALFMLEELLVHYSSVIFWVKPCKLENMWMQQHGAHKIYY